MRLLSHIFESPSQTVYCGGFDEYSCEYLFLDIFTHFPNFKYGTNTINTLQFIYTRSVLQSTASNSLYHKR